MSSVWIRDEAVCLVTTAMAEEVAMGTSQDNHGVLKGLQPAFLDLWPQF